MLYHHIDVRLFGSSTISSLPTCRMMSSWCVDLFLFAFGMKISWTTKQFFLWSDLCGFGEGWFGSVFCSPASTSSRDVAFWQTSFWSARWSSKIIFHFLLKYFFASVLVRRRRLCMITIWMERLGIPTRASHTKPTVHVKREVSANMIFSLVKGIRLEIIRFYAFWKLSNHEKTVNIFPRCMYHTICKIFLNLQTN